MTINFTLRSTSGPVSGRLSYVPSDYAFCFEADVRPAAYSSVQVNSLQLVLDHDGVLLYPRGYCPLIEYKETDSVPPESNRRATLAANMEADLVPGVAYTLGGPTDWPIWINKRSGWVCLGDPRASDHFQAVEFATGAIAVISGTELISVWLQPVTLPSHLVDQ
jgi:hypothetical protein